MTLLDARRVLGRGPPQADDPAPRVTFLKLRPWGGVVTPPLGDTRISRIQLVLSPLPDGAIGVTSVGRCPLVLGGQVAGQGIVRPGDTITLSAALVLLVLPPRARVQRLRTHPPEAGFPFGEADPHGIVGESTAAWALRDALAFAAEAGHHVLVLGESGVGKELAARALHARSPRRNGPFVARNAATLPEGLVDAELFGVVKGYPNAGSPELVGLLGQVDGGTLFLDEIGELPATLQVHLLRVLDAGGEYQRLGEGRTRRANFRLIAATNRPASALKGDFGARFKIRVEVVGLDRRREDIPLLLRHLLAAARQDNPRAVERFFERREGGPGVARIDPQVIEALLRHRFTFHTRELERLMWTSLATSPGDFLTVTPELRAELGLGGPAERALRAKRKTDPGEIGREELVAALAAAGGNVAHSAEKLGVSRFAVYRLMKRHGVSG